MKLRDYLKEKEAKVGKTTEATAIHKEHYHDDHYHMYEVNFYGHGQTTETVNGEDHVHEIMGWEVQEAHNHKHELNTHHKDY